MISFCSSDFNKDIADRQSLFGSIYNVYDDLNEKKNNVIAVTVSGKKDSQKRASAATIGAVSALIDLALLFGGYSLLKIKPNWSNKLFDRFIVKPFDKWLTAARNLAPGRSKSYQTLLGLYSKAIWAALVGAVSGYGWGVYRTIKSTFINGKISSTRPGAHGDWVAEGLKSLSKTKDGKALLKNSIVKNPDKTVTVKFDGVGKSYTFAKDELKQASKQYLNHINEKGDVVDYERKFSKGDGDVLAFEVALEKYLKDIRDGKIEIDPNVDIKYSTISEDGDLIFPHGTENDLYYLLTGKKVTDTSETSLINQDKYHLYQYDDQLFVYDAKSK